MGSKVVELSNVCSSNDSDSIIHQVAFILSNEWPQISYKNRVIRLKNHLECPGLTAIYLLLDEESGAVVGHAELNPSYNYKCSDSISKSVILTSFIINKANRGGGIGSHFLQQIETICQKNVSYLYLWAIGERNIKFYQKNGYHDCEPIASDVKVLQKIDEESLSKLDNLFLKRTIVEDDVTKWLRKRLIFQFQYRIIDPREQLANDISLHNYTKNIVQTSNFIRNQNEFYYYPQFGPSCGIVAALMALHFMLQSVSTAVFYGNCSSEALFHSVPSSILPKAIENGYTTDGEMFNIYDLHALLCLYTKDLSLPVDVVVSATSIFANNDKIMEIFDNETEYFPLLLIPYDRDQCGNIPGLFQGKKAHWAIIVGYIYDNTRLDLVGYQGMSDNPITAPSASWFASNEQLDTTKDTSKGCATNWIIDESGPLLKQRCILFQRNTKTNAE